MFYDNYIRLCNEIKKSPSAVALEIGISKPTVHRWKNGGSPTDATLRKIAEYFGVSASELREGNKKTPTQKGERDNKRDYLKLVEAFENADESTREAILLLLKLK